MDNWSHRSSKMACRACMYWVPKLVNKEEDAAIRSILGRCRRHAPTMAGWPAVFESDWCGDHKLDENKL